MPMDDEKAKLNVVCVGLVWIDRMIMECMRD